MPDGEFEGQGKDDPSVQISFTVDDRAVNDLEVTGITIRCRDGDEFDNQSLSADPNRLRRNQTFEVVIDTDAVFGRITGLIKDNDDVAVGSVEITARVNENGSVDANGRRCTSGKVPYRAERIPPP